MSLTRLPYNFFWKDEFWGLYLTSKSNGGRDTIVTLDLTNKEIVLCKTEAEIELKTKLDCALLSLLVKWKLIIALFVFCTEYYVHSWVAEALLLCWWNDWQGTKKTYQNNGGSCIGSGTGCLTKMGQWQWWGGGGGGQGWWRGGVRMGFHFRSPHRCSVHLKRDWCWLVRP